MGKVRGRAGWGRGIQDVEVHTAARRRSEWQADVAPENPWEDWLFDAIVLESIRLDRCLDRRGIVQAYERLRSGLGSSAEGEGAGVGPVVEYLREWATYRGRFERLAQLLVERRGGGRVPAWDQTDSTGS